MANTCRKLCDVSMKSSGAEFGLKENLFEIDLNMLHDLLEFPVNQATYIFLQDYLR